jgi:hypothetical protein
MGGTDRKNCIQQSSSVPFFVGDDSILRVHRQFQNQYQ